ncbi:MAG: dimethyl sulfoxide reductase anchor subunit [Rudaea sp.]|nr:dimethyl sulfoxide reductase anchor subunit [Rudaea sp.]
MHPALSVVFFTVVSGSGYGLLFLLGVGLAVDPQIINRSEALAMLAAGMLFAVAGLASSLLHLGQPQRAWRAFTQWRSSWLSREGVAAICSFMPLLALAGCLWRGADAGVLRALGAALAITATVTVYCTSGIYTSLKTVHAWHNAYVLPGYLLFALLGGASCLWMLHALIIGARDPLVHRSLLLFIVMLALGCAILKYRYWHFIDTTHHPATTESATGLGRFGQVRSVEWPHTEENYLTREMGFVLARKHSARLRIISLILFGAVPVFFAVIALAWPALTAASSGAAFLAGILGIFVERWLFFAEARHVVMLYYRA